VTNKTPALNSRFAKAGIPCFNESEVLNSSFVHLMKFSTENSRHIAKPPTVCDLKTANPNLAVML
jgi:hypothetical protein